MSPSATWQLDVRATVDAFSLDVTLACASPILVLIGANGSGKTTLMRTIAGATRPAAGRIAVAGHTLFDADTGLWRPPEQRHLGFVPQGYGLFPHLDVLRNVTFGRPSNGVDDPSARAQAILSDLDAAHLLGRRVTQLSGGEQQRVALARALYIDPSAVLLDEPMAALDAGTRRAVRQSLIRWLGEQARPALVATHDVRDVVALNALDTTIVALHAGRVAQQGRMNDLATAPANEFIAEFFEALPTPVAHP